MDQPSSHVNTCQTHLSGSGSNGPTSVQGPSDPDARGLLLSPRTEVICDFRHLVLEFFANALSLDATKLKAIDLEQLVSFVPISLVPRQSVRLWVGQGRLHMGALSPMQHFRMGATVGGTLWAGRLAY